MKQKFYVNGIYTEVSTIGTPVPQKGNIIHIPGYDHYLVMGVSFDYVENVIRIHIKKEE